MAVGDTPTGPVISVLETMTDNVVLRPEATDSVLPQIPNDITTIPVPASQGTATEATMVGPDTTTGPIVAGPGITTDTSLPQVLVDAAVSIYNIEFYTKS